MTAQLDELLTTFRRWLHLPDAGALYAVLAAVAANRMAGDPVWLLVVGPPGGGKTEILGPLGGLVDVHPAATLTVASLLSGTPKKEREDGARGGLLRVIDEFGIIVCKDFGSVLSMNRDARAELLAALREIYDGSWTRHVGTGGGQTLGWAGKVGLVAACTPAIDSHHAVMGSMGERFAIYRLPSVDDAAQARRALSHAGREREMRADLAAGVRTFFAGINFERKPEPLEEADLARLITLAVLAVRCRSAVERDSHTREIELIPQPEAPGRLAQVLARILGSLRSIGADDATAWRVVTKIALDSMPALRRTTLEQLIALDGTQITTGLLAETLGYPTTTTRRTLEDLTAHGLVARDAGGQGKADRWAATQWARDHWNATVPETSEPLISKPQRVFDDFSGTLESEVY